MRMNSTRQGILSLLAVTLGLAGCGRDSHPPAQLPVRDLGDLETVAREDSAGTAARIGQLLDLEPPLRLDEIDRYWDGGSVGGRFVDARGETLRFSYSAWMSDEAAPERLYLGAEHFRRPEARLVPAGAEEEAALAAALFLYGPSSGIGSELAKALCGDPVPRYQNSGAAQGR